MGPTIGSSSATAPASTSHGAYAREEPTLIAGTRGSAKEQRPPLKQVVLSLLPTSRATIPVWLEVMSGNQSDKEHFVPTIKAYTAQLQGSEPPYYVVDSARSSKDHLQELAEIHQVVPARRNVRVHEVNGLDLARRGRLRWLSPPPLHYKGPLHQEICLLREPVDLGRTEISHVLVDH